MTIKIQTSFGEFEGETLKEAQKLFRKAQKIEAKKQAEQSALGSLANERAFAAGYNVLHRKVNGEKAPCGWRFYATGSKYGPHAVEHFDSCNRKYHVVTYDTPHGRATLDHYGYECLGHVWNGSGHTVVVFLQDNSRDTPPIACAVGVAGDQCRLADLPTITMEWFRRDEQLAEAA